MVRESESVQKHKAVLIQVKKCSDNCFNFEVLEKDIGNCAF